MIRGVTLRAPTVFLASTFVTFLIFRLPIITSGRLLNLDEAQMTAQAITFLRHPIPWRDFDGTTSGPLDTIAVAIPGLFGILPTLHTSRLLSVVLLTLTLFCIYSTLRQLWGDAVARVAIMLPLSLLCGAADGSYVQYTSETVPLLLIAIALMLMVRLPKDAFNPWLVGGSGLLIGSLVFAKLQAAPFAVFLSLAFLGLLWNRASKQYRARAFALFGAGLLAPLLFIVGITAWNGVLYDFLLTYVLFPSVYIAGNCCHLATPEFFFSDGPFAAYFIVSILVIAGTTTAALLLKKSANVSLGKQFGLVSCFFVAMMVVAIYAIEAPQTPFIHYLLFLVIPVSGLAGTCLGTLISMLSASDLPHRVLVATIAVIAIGSLVPTLQPPSSDESAIGRNFFYVQPPLDPVVPTLVRLIAPHHRVAMWGWMPQYLVYTGSIMGTRDSISQFQIEDRPLRGYYRDRYISDFERNRPDFLIEAIGPAAFAYHDRAAQGIGSFPALLHIVDSGYRLIYETDSLRLYKRM